MPDIAVLMGALCPDEGVYATALPGVRLSRSTRGMPRTPLLYQQGIVILGQGEKTVHLGGRAYVYDPGHYLVLTVPLPAECETAASPEHPLLGMAVDIDMEVLRGIIGQMDAGGGPARPGCAHQGLYVAEADPEFTDTLARLLRALAAPEQARVLGPGLVRKLIYRAIKGENAAALYALAAHNTGMSRIDKALRRIHDHFSRPFRVEELAGEVNMSPSTFHRTFKEVTSLSPIQYLKQVRLNKAKSLLLEGGVRAGDAARLVGYESVSQFTREFRRYFGSSPGHLPERNPAPGPSWRVP